MHIQDTDETKSIPLTSQISEATGTSNGEAPKKKKKKKKKPAADRLEETTKENSGKWSVEFSGLCMKYLYEIYITAEEVGRTSFCNEKSCELILLVPDTVFHPQIVFTLV